ncbi:ribonuclease D [Teichococcus oryzae]|uniref:Ribonuclease D n=1 Tax=Teichococcus oryzae TaxID=1608942 RepID=A0A5B2TK41_9PROT|nr:ribonuclease D [Pseudoroseomonas oryzae]KAA2214826.1 ribonuclease D [Pseudoroseomonas oryzae]
MSRRNQAQDADPVLITTTEALAELCARLRAEPFVTVDTEFMREKTYWPELCVVQLGGREDVAVIDAQAEGIDLAPLGELFADPAVTKVFHAARQDVEICILRFGAPPRPLFDTQVAAMVAGFGDQASYDSLVRGLAGASIDKAHRFSDWSARPLSAAQVAYAAADVTHLRRVYTALVERLTQDGRLSWVAEEMAELMDPATYRQDPETAWERLKPRTANRRYLAAIRAAAAWREREAQRVNIPRQRLVRDETLLEIAATQPATAAELSRARGITKGFAEGKAGAGLLAALATARELPESDLPEPPRQALNQGTPASPALIALLKVLLAAKAEEHHVAPRLIASSDELERLASESEPSVPALHGWRRQVFGQSALALKNGRLALGVEGRKVKLIPG